MADFDKISFNFDFSDLKEQIDSVKDSYKDFGSSSQEAFKDFSKDFQEVKTVVNSINDSVFVLKGNMDNFFNSFSFKMQDFVKTFEKLREDSSVIIENMKGMTLSDMRNLFKNLETEDPNNKIKDIINPTNVTLPGGEGNILEASKKKQAKKQSDDKDDKDDKLGEFKLKLKQTVAELKSFVTDEVQSTKKKLGSIASSAFPGIQGGGLFSSLLSMVVLGVQESQRIGAEAGELRNVFEATGEQLYTKQMVKVNKWFSDFQENAQWQYAIPRAEVQGIIKQLVDAGFKSDDIIKRFNKGLGEVGSNVVTLTLGLDKHFNQAAGTAMGQALDLVSNYGDTLEDAADKIMKIGFAGQKSGMGVRDFTSAVMAGSSSLTQYGIDIKDVAQAMLQLKKHFTDMGLDDKFAGSQAAKGLSAMGSGISGMSSEMQMALAAKLFPGLDPFQSRNQLLEGWGRVSEGKDEGFYVKLIKTIYSLMEEMGGNDIDQIKYMLMDKFPSMGIEGANALVTLAPTLKEGVELTKAQKDQMEGPLRKAFETEGTQLTELQKTQRELIAALRDIGLGILKLLSGLIGTLVVGFKSLPVLIDALTSAPGPARDAKFQSVQEAMSVQTGMVLEGISDFAKGAEGFAGALGDFLKGMFGNVVKAIEFEPPGGGLTKRLEGVIEDVAELVDSDVARWRVTTDVMTSLDMMGADLARSLGATGLARAYEIKAQEKAKDPDWALKKMIYITSGGKVGAGQDAKTSAYLQKLLRNQKAGFDPDKRFALPPITAVIKKGQVQESLDKSSNNSSFVGP